ncbi:hypothetical protein AWB76_03519 [Caballeronia temeraria]|uniref:Uncharacterized protein n=2 Tax=Caballeronia temeraria TaxID=1777137 RepID=A0A158B3M4_9BURK|nr:hypothetical protein AWB76_03519 [Caballeronia temeraria]
MLRRANVKKPRENPSGKGVWIRVFDVSPAGKKRLVALAWRRTPFRTEPDTNDAPDDTDLAFGLPDGSVKWRNKAAFLKAWNIDLDARSLSGAEAKHTPS